MLLPYLAAHFVLDLSKRFRLVKLIGREKHSVQPKYYLLIPQFEFDLGFVEQP